MSTALVLAGHGSHLNARSSEAVRAHARTLATSNTWDEVLVAFWKEEPSLARALDGCTASDVVVVPVFMSEGYFTSEVIPAEMGLDGPVTRREGRTIRYTRPVGVHPALAGIIVERALDAGASPDDPLFVTLGHGVDAQRRQCRSGCRPTRTWSRRTRANLLQPLWHTEAIWLQCYAEPLLRHHRRKSPLRDAAFWLASSRARATFAPWTRYYDTSGARGSLTAVSANSAEFHSQDCRAPYPP